jgi:hypothetical protein
LPPELADHRFRMAPIAAAAAASDLVNRWA